MILDVRIVQRTFLCGALASLIVAPIRTEAQARPAEYEVKAAYLYQLGRFVEWPARAAPAAEAEFAICVLGWDPFGSRLDSAIAGMTIDNRAVVARRLREPNEALRCRVVFLSASEDSRLATLLTALGGAPVLTVGDGADFTRKGGMIQFVLDGNRVRFEVNVANTSRAGLTLRSDLLRVAVNVRRS
jgi:hypothetical protein